MLAISILFFALFSIASSLVIPRQTPPAGWATDYLEPYKQYHERYLAIGCQNEHSNTQFFDDCCHPLLATETLQTARPAKCIPSTSTTDSPDPSPVPAPAPAPPASAPSPSPSPKPSPSPSPNPAPAPAAPSPSPTPSKAATSASNSGGVATYFWQNGVAGACGTVHSDNDLIAAIDAIRYGDTGLVSLLCGRKVKITNTDNQKSVIVTIVDACPTCINKNSIDLSYQAFKAIADPTTGQVPIVWAFTS